MNLRIDSGVEVVMVIMVYIVGDGVVVLYCNGILNGVCNFYVV